MSAALKLKEIKNKVKKSQNEEEIPYIPQETPSINLFTILLLFTTIATTFYYTEELNDKVNNSNLFNTTIENKDNIVDNSERITFRTEEEDQHILKNIEVKKKARNTTITNAYDRSILRHLQKGELLYKHHQYPECISHFEKVYNKYPNSPRAVYGQAKCLTALAEELKSNDMLRESLKMYEAIPMLDNVPNELVRICYLALGENYNFLGEYRQSILAYDKLVKILPNDTEALTKLGISYLYVNAYLKALPHFQKALQIEPSDGWVKVHVGFVFYSLQRYDEAVKWLKAGIQSNHEGVHHPRFYFHLGDAYNRLRRTNEAWQVYHLGAENGVFLSAMQRSLYNAETKLRARPWWTVEESGYKTEIKLLEYHWKSIREEALSALRADGKSFLPESEKLLEAGDWKQLELFTQGQKVKYGCSLAPKTCKLIENMKEAANNQRGQVKFSLMQPGTHVWAHTGPTNCRLRVHLGLIIPKNVYIRVGEETKTWQNGKAIVIDDSFDHEVWHNGTKQRLILIVDFWHPDVPDWERQSLSAI